MFPDQAPTFMTDFNLNFEDKPLPTLYGANPAWKSRDAVHERNPRPLAHNKIVYAESEFQTEDDFM